MAWASGTPPLAVAIVTVILLNASFSFVQELQAERAVEALAAFLPERARVLRDGSRQEIEARVLVPGDVLLIEEGERVCADARLMSGTGFTRLFIDSAQIRWFRCIYRGDGLRNLGSDDPTPRWATGAGGPEIPGG
jgi:magnesium-transporting ATPase (P-type)